MLTAYFKKFGHGAVAVGSGHEAIEAFAPGRFALLLADVNLGSGMNGVALALKLREQDPELKVFMMSGEPACLALAKSAGVGTCLAKPLDLAQMPRLLGLKA
jgi:CheY-like chemotaxis protein